MKIRSGNRRRAKAHARAEAERIRQWRLKKLRRLVIREVLKRMTKHFEDLILYGSKAADGMRGLGAAFEGLSKRVGSGGEISEISLVDRPAYPWGGGPEFVILKDKPITIPGMAAIKDPGA
jgi:hypothetical protein